MDAVKAKAARLGSGKGLPFTRSVLHGAVLALFLGTAFLFFASLLLYRLSDPLRYFPYFAPAASLLLSFFGGMRAGGLHKKSGALTGITVGLLLSFLFLLAALILSEGHLTLMALLLYIGMLLASTLGGFLATRKRHKRRRR